MTKLALMPIVDRLEPVTPAAFHEREAAMYLRINVHHFRDMVHRGVIPYIRHEGRRRRLYAKTDLDDYLRKLHRCTMAPRDVPPAATVEESP